MHPRLAPIAAFLEDSRARLVAAALEIAPEDSARRPSPEAWSPDEILTHSASAPICYSPRSDRVRWE